jgi:prolyl 4-hydroxylase
MSVVIKFSSGLSAWIVENLDRGRQPTQLIQDLVEQRIEQRAARAIVDAFVTARASNRPVPVDSVTIESGPPEYVYEKPLLPPGSRIATFDRAIGVVARADRPVLAALTGVLAADECEELIEMARPRLERSTVADARTGEDVVAAHRSSVGMFFRPQENPLVARLDRRLAELMNLPIENGEGLQILHYPVGAQFPPHFDFLQDSNAANRASIARSGQRVSTVITYLNDVESGGETVFPAVGWTVFPQRGNAVYFEYCNGSGQVDSRSLHGGCPVLRGEKWIATKWMRQRRFVPAAAVGYGTSKAD